MGSFDLQRVDEPARRLKLIQQDLCGDAKAAVDEVIIEDKWILAIVGCGHAIDSEAIGRKLSRARNDIRRIVIAAIAWIRQQTPAARDG